MKTYVIIAQDPKGERKMIWIHEKDYQSAKVAFQYGYPNHEAISMWLRVRS